MEKKEKDLPFIPTPFDCYVCRGTSTLFFFLEIIEHGRVAAVA